MKLVHLLIHNFRGIHDAHANLFDYNLFVGPNNAGKSTVIDALRVFYEKDGFKYKQDWDFPFIAGADEESWIELTFTLTEEEDASLAEDYRREDRTLRVRKFFRSGDKNRVGSIFGYKTDDSLSDEPFYGAKNVQSGKFGDIVFIPAVSKVDEHTKLSGPSALRDLLTNVLQAVVASSPSYEKFSKDFETFAKVVKTEKTGNGRSLAGLEEDLSSLLGSWGTVFQLEMKSPSMPEIIKTLLSYQKQIGVTSKHRTYILQRHIFLCVFDPGPGVFQSGGGPRPSRDGSDLSSSIPWTTCSNVTRLRSRSRRSVSRIPSPDSSGAGYPPSSTTLVPIRAPHTHDTNYRDTL